MRKAPFHMLLFFSVLTLAACGGASTAGQSPSPTPTPAPNALNVYVSTAANSAQNAVYALSGATGKRLWSDATGTSENSSPVLDHGVLYVGSDSGLDALNTQDGKRLWSYQAPGFVKTLFVVNGVVYGGSFALNASDGSLRWKSQNTDFSGLALLADGVIYAEASQGSCGCSAPDTYTLALNARDGSVLWKTPKGTDDFSPQLEANGLLYGIDYFPDGPVANLLVRKASDGSVAWQFPKVPAAVTIIGLDSDVIYALSNDGDFPDNPNIVYALKASDGSVIWHTQVADMTPTSPTLIDQVIYLGSQDGGVTALNETDGKMLWHAQVGQAGPSSRSDTTIAAVVNGVVYLAYPQGFAALNASDGSLKWQYQASGSLTIAAVANGVVYASSGDSDLMHPENNKIYALNASDGSLLWHSDMLSGFNPPVVG